MTLEEKIMKDAIPFNSTPEVDGYFIKADDALRIAKEYAEERINEFIGNNKGKYNRIYNDPTIGGVLVGTLGSMKYILDPKTFERLTTGHHNLWMHKGSLFGNVGAKEERVFVNHPQSKNKNLP